MDAGGPRLIFNVLSKQCESAAVVQAGLAALAVAAQFVPVPWHLACLDALWFSQLSPRPSQHLCQYLP